MSDYNTGKALGNNVRLTWTRHVWILEELPVKGGPRHLRTAQLQNPLGNGHVGYDAFIPDNILRVAPVSAEDTYDTITAKLLQANLDAAEEVITKGPGREWLRDTTKWWEETVYFTKVKPEGKDKFTATGKDFTVTCEWTRFQSYSPSSDFQQSDPHYTYYESTAATAARKLYELLQKSPAALADVSWSAFSDWLKANKISYDTHFSVWH